MTATASAPGDLEPIETASEDELRSLQLERLRWSLRHAYENVPHYRRLLDISAIHPDDCKDLSDLAKFPFTSKAELRDNYPFGMFAVPREQVVRVHASSGTTGRATVVGYTLQDLDTWATVMARSIRAAGGRPGHILHNAYGYGLFTGGMGAHYGAEKLGCTVIPVSGGMTGRQVTLIRDFRPDIIMVTPSYMLAIIDEMEKQGLDPAHCSLRYGIFGAEPWTNEMRAEMEARAGIDATDIYGLSEVIGPGVAQECVETKDGLHIWEDHFYPEVIDPITGGVLPDGELGELVFIAELALSIWSAVSCTPVLLAAAPLTTRQAVYTSLTGSSSALLGLAIAAVTILAAFGPRAAQPGGQATAEPGLARARAIIMGALLAASFFLLVLLVTATVALPMDAETAGNWAITTIIESAAAASVVGLLLSGLGLALVIAERSRP